MKPEDRDMTWGDVQLLVAAADKEKTNPELLVAVRCGVDVKTAKSWVSKVRTS